MRQLLTILFICLGLSAFAQPVKETSPTSITSLIQHGIFGRSLGLPVVAAVPTLRPSLTAGKGVDSVGATVYCKADSSVYNWTGTQWKKSGGISAFTFTPNYNNKLFLLYTNGVLTDSVPSGVKDVYGINGISVIDSIGNVYISGSGSGSTDTSLIREIVSDSIAGTLNIINDTSYRSTEQLNDTTFKQNKTVTKGTVFIFEPGNIAARDTNYTLKHLQINVQTSSYTLLLSDDGKIINMNVGSANNLTVPVNSSVPFPIGTSVTVVQYGSGETTINPTVGVTVRTSGSRYKLFEQYSTVVLTKIGVDEWILNGDTEL